MSLASDLKAHLAADAALAALVGERVYPMLRPEGSALPAVVYQMVTHLPAQSLDGFTGKLVSARVQIDSYAETFDAAESLALLVRARMLTAAARLKATVITGQDFYESESRLFRRMLDFSVWHTEE